MKKCIAFIKRNFIEMFRDPVLYIFCIGFPIVMILIFNIIYNSIGEYTLFTPSSLMPGMLMFSSSFLMLMMSLIVSHDKSSMFLKRLYVSPLKTFHFIIGYTFPCFLLGIIQAVICLLAEWLLTIVFSYSFIAFDKCLLLVVLQIPLILINIFLGIIFGVIFNDKSSPALSSIVLSASSMLGGAWMPLDTMGNFEKVCLFLPFYPATYLGRVITKAPHSIVNETITCYSFDDKALVCLLVIFIYLIVISIASCVIFSYSKKEK